MSLMLCVHEREMTVFSMVLYVSPFHQLCCDDGKQWLYLVLLLFLNTLEPTIFTQLQSFAKL